MTNTIRLTFIFIILASAVWGQNTFPTSGFAGAGTTSPQAQLHVVNSDPRQLFRLYWSGSSSNYLSLWQGYDAAIIDPIGTGQLRLGYDRTTTVTMGISDTGANNDGRLGIGTATPAGKLHVVGSIYSNATKTNTIFIGNLTTQNANFVGSEGYWALRTSTNNSFNLDLFNAGTPIVGMTALQNGNFGIGTITPDAKLSVKGTVHAQEVKVDLNGAIAPDYVFNKHYVLPSLDEIKSYIEKNNRLPEMPSAKEMEANGLNLGEMNLMLLKKVEELTLYIITQNRTLQKQEDELELQAERISRLEQSGNNK